MSRVTGLGGVFFKAENPQQMYEWYEKHLGLKRVPDGSSVVFPWRYADQSDRQGMTVWSIFSKDTKYFHPSGSNFMLNYRVENLDEVLKVLAEEGVEIDPHREDFEYGRFAWIMDPEGNRIELWEPPKES